MASLQEQLLKAGIIDEKKAKQAKKEQRKAAKQNKGQTQPDEAKLAAARAQAEKAERDRALNRERQAAAEQKAIQAQIVQLITTNRIDRGQGDIAYQFVDGKKIKKIYVTAALQAQLTRGQVAVVGLGQGYELVPAAVAEKISQRNPASVLVLHDRQLQSTDASADEDDPYADYQIPDDLMW